MRVHPHDVLQEIAAERMRQIDEEGWSPEHDDEHDDSELAAAAAAYARYGQWHTTPGRPPQDAWPWDADWWKPADHRRNCVKAAALLVAEIERLDRAASVDTHPKGGDVQQAPAPLSGAVDSKAGETPKGPSQ